MSSSIDMSKQLENGTWEEDPASLVEVMDSLGFPLQLTRDDEAARRRCEAKAAERARRWGAVQPARGQRYPQRPSGELKKLVRKGVPAELRREVWLDMSGARARREAAPEEYYRGLLASEGESEAQRQIESDLHRTFPANERFCEADLLPVLKRILLAYAAHNPVVGYCQSMNYLAGFLLLFVADEEEAFWLLVSLLEGLLFPGIHSRELSGTLVEFRVLQHLLDRKQAKLAKHLHEIGCDLTLICTEWLLCCFCKSLPAETAARVWDAIFSEGSKIFFRVALALLKGTEEDILKAAHPGAVMRALQKRTRRAHDRDKLLSEAFKGVGSLPMGHIAQLRQTHLQQVEDELASKRAARSKPTSKQK